MKQISIDPITRLEGHGKIEIFLDDDGGVANAYFQVPELRGFEKFVEGMPVEEVPRIVTRICGVCPAAHHLACGQGGRRSLPCGPAAGGQEAARAVLLSAHFVHSHIAHFYALAAPDFVVGPDCDPAKRNILGVVGEGRTRDRGRGDQAPPPCAGHPDHGRRQVHPSGVDAPGRRVQRDHRGAKAADRRDGEVVRRVRQVLPEAFDDVVLKNKAYLDLVLSDVYEMDTAT